MGIRNINRIQNNLRRARRIAGFTQRQVAKKLGITGTSRISRWEKGLSLPSLTNFLKLSILYRTMPHDLYHDYITALSKDFISESLSSVTGDEDHSYINYADEFS